MLQKTENQKLVIFDLDGTLIDTAPDLAYCVDLIMVEIGLPKQGTQKVRRYIGNGVRRLIQDILTTVLENEPDKELLEKAFDSFTRHYQINLTRKSFLYPNIDESLKKLKLNNFKLACITNKLEAFTLPLLEHFQIYKYFDLVLSGDSLEKKKPDAFPLKHACSLLGIAIEDSMMVGDSKNDMLAAKSAGMACACVSYGYTDKKAISQLKPDFVLDSLSQLLDYV